MTEFSLPNNTGYKGLPEGVYSEDIQIGTIVEVAYTDAAPTPVFITQVSEERPKNMLIYFRGYARDFEEFGFESDQIVRILYNRSYLVDLMDNAD